MINKSFTHFQISKKEKMNGKIEIKTKNLGSFNNNVT